MNIYVGNLSFNITEADLREAFEKYGQVASAKVIHNHFRGADSGYGFVEMPNNSEADRAMKALNGAELKGSTLKLSEARPRSNKKRGRRRRSW